MYIKGDVNIGRVTDYSNIDYKDFDNAAYLPHSCDKWVIGGPAEILMLIEDLQAILKQMEDK